MSTQVEDFANILAMLAAAYPRYALTKETTKVYADFLSDIPIDELRLAAKECATRYDFFPSVHEIRAVVVDLRCKTRNIPNGYAAWEDLLHAGNGIISWVEQENGQNVIVKTEYKFIHPMVKKVAIMLGWPRTFPSSDDISYDRNTFIKAYTLELQAETRLEMMVPEVRKSIGVDKPVSLLEAANGLVRPESR